MLPRYGMFLPFYRRLFRMYSLFGIVRRLTRSAGIFQAVFSSDDNMLLPEGAENTIKTCTVIVGQTLTS